MKLWRIMTILAVSLHLLLAGCVPSAPIPTPTPTSTTTPSPTYTPTPTSTSTATPAPQARISEPIDNQRIPPNVKVIVEYKDIPHDRYLWVAVRIPDVRPPGPPLTRWIYPQLQDGKVPPHLEGAGTFVIDAAFGGGSKDSGVPFNVLVLLVDANAQESFTEYAGHCGPFPATCLGMKLPDTGVEILDFSTVIRQ